MFENSTLFLYADAEIYIYVSENGYCLKQHDDIDTFKQCADAWLLKHNVVSC